MDALILTSRFTAGAGSSCWRSARGCPRTLLEPLDRPSLETILGPCWLDFTLGPLDRVAEWWRSSARGRPSMLRSVAVTGALVLAACAWSGCSAPGAGTHTQG